MKFALDYDRTFTEDPAFWYVFLAMAVKFGHTVTIVTLRNGELDTIPEQDHFAECGVKILYCDGLPKLRVVREEGLGIDVWIDDNPKCILQGSHLTGKELADWRADQRKGINTT